jgi:3-hydroxyisobutyrate dehydrogenase
MPKQMTVAVLGAGGTMGLPMARNIAQAGMRVRAWNRTPVVEGGAETIALAEGMGVDPALMFDALEGGPLDLPYLRMKGEAIAERNFEPSFALRLAAKDARLVQASAADRGLDLPVLAAIHRRLDEGVPEHGDDDVSATFLTSAPRSGVR